MLYNYNQQNLALTTWLNAQTKDIIEELDLVSKIRDYYDSVQPNVLTDKQREYMGLKPTDDEPRDNFIRDAIELISERLSVQGWEASHPSNDEGLNLSLAIQTIMENNDMDSTQDDIFTAALRDGLAYVIVDYDTSKTGLDGVRFQILPRAYIDYNSDDGNEQIMGVRLHKDEYGKVMFASNRYIDYNIDNDGPVDQDIEINQFLTIYKPDSIERYIMRGARQKKVNSDFSQSGWERYFENPGDSWPIPWMDENNNPLGVPVFEFETPGGPIINRSLLSIQDAINANFADTIALDRLHGFPIVLVTGLTMDDELTLSPGEILNLTSDKATVTRLTGESSENLHKTLETYMEKVARQTSIPLYQMFESAIPPSGTSLRIKQARLIEKCERIQRNYEKAFMGICEMSLKLALIFGQQTGLLLDAIDKGSVKPIWAKPYYESVEEKTALASAYKASGLPDEYIWGVVWGLDPQEIQKYSALKQASKNQAVVTAVNALQQMEQQEKGEQDEQENE